MPAGRAASLSNATPQPPPSSIRASSSSLSPMSPSPSPAADWSQAPTDILHNILARLPLATDRLRFASVCSPWRSAASFHPSPPPPQIPWLLLPSSNSSSSPHRFYSLPERRSYRLDFPLLRGRRIIGSSEGLLVFVDADAELHMLDPVSRSAASLPPLATLPDLEPSSTPASNYIYRFPPPYPPRSYDLDHMRDRFFTKLILSPGSTTATYLAVAIYRAPEKLALARSGDDSWTTIQMPFMGFKDIIFHNGILYAVNYLGKIAACELTDPLSPKVYPVAQGFLPPLPPLTHISKYLVVSSGELMQVWRLVRRSKLDASAEEYGFCTKLCSLSRMDLGSNEWVEVKSLGDHALFLGQNRSVSIPTRDFPELRRNCIYFTDDYNVDANMPHRGRDLGVYNLEDESIEPLWSLDSDLNCPPPVWFTPNLP